MTTEDGSLESPLDQLLQQLDLDETETDHFVGNPGEGEGRLFGGMVAAQCVVAAGRSVQDPARRLHSLHAYFLRTGHHESSLRFEVERVRDGRSFTTRHVTARQDGKTIFNVTASFCLEEEGIAHQDPMPEAPPPDGLPDWEQERAKLPGSFPPMRSSIELRMIDPWSNEKSPAHQRTWMRVRGELPENPLVHAAMLVYATDRTLLGTAARPHGIPWEQRMNLSLDHAVWIHHPVHLDDWLLYVSNSPVAHGAHGLVLGAVFTRDGSRLASVAQEGLIRLRR